MCFTPPSISAAPPAKSNPQQTVADLKASALTQTRLDILKKKKGVDRASLIIDPAVATPGGGEALNAGI